MPIKPENRHRYPPDWPQIVARVRERSADRCEGSPAFPNCRIRNGVLGAWLNGRWCPAVPLGERRFRLVWPEPGTEGWVRDELGRELHRMRIVRIVLTVGHLDHTPENCAMENLRHWCQRCHLNYDKKHHAQTAYMTRRANRQTLELPF